MVEPEGHTNRDTVNFLNRLLREESAAVEAYRKLAGRLIEPERSAWQRLGKQHEETMDALRGEIELRGGDVISRKDPGERWLRYLNTIEEYGEVRAAMDELRSLEELEIRECESAMENAELDETSVRLLQHEVLRRKRENMRQLERFVSSEKNVY